MIIVRVPFRILVNHVNNCKMHEIFLDAKTKLTHVVMSLLLLLFRLVLITRLLVTDATRLVKQTLNADKRAVLSAIH